VSEAPEPPNGAQPPSEPGPPSAWRIAGAILALPFTATVVVPGTIVATGDASVGLGIGDAPAALAIVLSGALICAGVGVFAWTVGLFASAGRGTLAPWDPSARLVVAGPYRYVRHPMITGVALVLAGETVALGSVGIGIWLVAFITVNAIYLPLVEEPALRRRFGRDYDRYAANVPRWIPRPRPCDQ
jgi:protein-S-isoprenylcysteine O-methyltransferase Ste14